MCRDGVENIIWSASEGHVLKMQWDGKLVLYRLAVPGAQSTGTPVWAWEGGRKGAFVVMERSGVLAYYHPDGTPVTSTPIGTRARPLSWLKVQDDGKLVIYTDTNVPVMQSCITAASGTRKWYGWCLP